MGDHLHAHYSDIRVKRQHRSKSAGPGYPVKHTVALFACNDEPDSASVSIDHERAPSQDSRTPRACKQLGHDERYSTTKSWPTAAISSADSGHGAMQPSTQAHVMAYCPESQIPSAMASGTISSGSTVEQETIRDNKNKRVVRMPHATSSYRNCQTRDEW